MENIGLLIKQKRLDLGMKLEDLAKRVGVSAATVSRWESGKIDDMKRSRIKALSDTLGIPVYILMGWEEPKEMKNNPFTDEEMTIIENYRVADREVQHLIKYLLLMESSAGKGEK